jgi:hypothetical protein
MVSWDTMDQLHGLSALYLPLEAMCGLSWMTCRFFFERYDAYHIVRSGWLLRHCGVMTSYSRFMPSSLVYYSIPSCSLSETKEAFESALLSSATMPDSRKKEVVDPMPFITLSHIESPS